MTRGDYGVIACVLAVVIASFVIAASPGEPTSVTIRGPQGASIIPVDTDATYRIQGEIGLVTFRVADGEVRCVDSSCPNHVCVHSGAVTPGRPVVCAPNGVVASVTDATGEGLDAISR